MELGYGGEGFLSVTRMNLFRVNLYRVAIWQQLAPNLAQDTSHAFSFPDSVSPFSPHESPHLDHPVRSPCFPQRHLLPRHDAPRPDHVVRVPREQRLPVRAPRQAHALRLPALLAHGRVFRLQLVDLALLLQVEDDDGARRGGAEPVPVGGEDEGVDLVAGGQGVEVLGLVEVPEHGRAVFAARGAEGTVGGDGHRVDVARVPDVVGLDAAGG